MYYSHGNMQGIYGAALLKLADEGVEGCEHRYLNSFGPATQDLQRPRPGSLVFMGGFQVPSFTPLSSNG